MYTSSVSIDRAGSDRDSKNRLVVEQRRFWKRLSVENRWINSVTEETLPRETSLLCTVVINAARRCTGRDRNSYRLKRKLPLTRPSNQRLHSPSGTINSVHYGWHIASRFLRDTFRERSKRSPRWFANNERANNGVHRVYTYIHSRTMAFIIGRTNVTRYTSSSFRPR